MESLLSLPAAGILLSIGAYLAGVFARRLIRHPLANPLAIANILIILVRTRARIKCTAFYSNCLYSKEIR
jgi:putative effector of murein hydrolase